MNAAFARQLPLHRPLGRPSPASGRGRKNRQRGISMFVVMIILMLALILVLGGLTVTNLNESLVGNQSDAQRAYGSAQALLDAAQRDIRLNGLGCVAAVMGGSGTHRDFPARGIATACTLRFPRSEEDYEDMVTGRVPPGLGQCGSTSDTNYDGVCISGDPADANFTSDRVDNGGAQLSSNGASYTSTFLTPLVGDANYGGGATTGGGATLAAGGTYWVEVFPYNVNSVALGSGLANSVPPDPGYPFVFRITVLGQGLKGATTRSVLRTYYTPYPMKPS